MINYFFAFLHLRYALYWRKKNLDKMLSLLEKAIQKYCEYSFLFLHLGLGYQEKGENEKAYYYVEKAQKLDISNPTLYLFTGKVLWDQGRYQESLDAFKESIEKDRHNQLAWNYLALAHLALEEYKDYQNIIKNQGMSENQELQIRMILTLENKIRKWNTYETQSFETSE